MEDRPGLLDWKSMDGTMLVVFLYECKHLKCGKAGLACVQTKIQRAELARPAPLANRN